MTMPSPSRRLGPIGAAQALAIALVASVALLAGCNNEKKSPWTQAVFKVGNQEITVDQINDVLSTGAPIPPEQAASASQAVLNRLIDQALTLQKAEDQKLDRDPLVIRRIEAARREIISRAYLEKLGNGAPKPTPAEVVGYYEAHPALFKARRLYTLQEVNIEAPPQQVEDIKKTLVGSNTFADFVAYLRSNNIRFTGDETVRAAEQLPLADVDAFAKMKDGQAIFNVHPGGAHVISLAASRLQPVSLQQATPTIEQFLFNERKRKLIADDLQALRSSLPDVYMGDFAKDAKRHPYRPPSAPDLPPLTTIPPTLPVSQSR
jgi:EpsD family peptidyl-prolyl cis-trans isomerase